MACYIRLMRKEDVPQVAEIDHEAFPTMLPPPNFENELKNKLAHYIVSCDEEIISEESAVKVPAEKGIPKLTARLKQFFHYEHSLSRGPPLTGQQYIQGFAGIWLLADEAHLMNLAVREKYRQQGIGELLLISMIDLATELNAHIITLEVRVSNTAAQKLYQKYGFTQAGLRRGYYIDNKEDAAIMSTKNIASPPFRAKLKKLKEDYSKRWGITDFHIGR